jgi:hypothetical protein
LLSPVALGARIQATLIVAAHHVAEARRIVANQSSPSNGGRVHNF